MFKIESLTANPKSTNQVDLLHQQMECVSKALQSDLIDSKTSSRSATTDYKSTDEEAHLTGESLVEDEFNQQRVGSAEFTSQSSSDESNESSSASSSSEDEEPVLSHSFRQTHPRGVPSSINPSFKPKKKEDLFLNQLEVDRFAPKKLFGRCFVSGNFPYSL